jgi:hypothetical protein
MTQTMTKRVGAVSARNCPAFFGLFSPPRPAIRHEDHEQHEDMLRWASGRFDPEAFDPIKATKRMWRGLPDWRSERWI